MHNILFIGAHPDDVELGCGGAILKHLENGDAVYVMVVTDGESGSKTEHINDDRLTETIQSLNFAGLERKNIICLHLPDTEVWRERQKLLDSITQACMKYKIDHVYTHSAESYHQDHITIFGETVSAKGTSGVFAYETNGGTKASFAPNFFIDIEGVLKKKLHMLQFHKSQSGKNYFDLTAIEVLSRVRAAQSKIYKYAEAFELLRLSLSITPPEKSVSLNQRPVKSRKKNTPLLPRGIFEMNILVTGAGGPAGVCTIKALKGKHRVIAADMDSYASGIYLANKGYKVPACNHPLYFTRILEICRKENVTFLFPTVGEELLAFAKAAQQFKDEGVTVAVSGYTSLLIANNKLSTYDFFKEKPYCPSLYDEKTTEFPCVVKPINSRGGRGFNICTDQASLQVALERNKVYGDSVIMEYLKGNEYSVYGLSDLTAKPILSLANRRIMAKGESKVAELAPNVIACKVAESIASGVGLVGPWNVQLINVNGCYKIVEINPRIAGSVSLIMASGIDYIGLVIKVFTDQEITPEELVCSNPVYMIRYNEEIFVKPENIQQ